MGDLRVDQYSYYQTVICNLMEICFPTKIVTRHTADQPGVTDWFRDIVRKRQRAHVSGDLNQAHNIYCVIRSIEPLRNLSIIFTKHKLQQCMNRDPTIGGSI